ncbi:hypothetical protein SPRG_11038 [Saprolegnia parasitica CBS 223.65]|uniref:Uncharacterized protein n=1 Tax=Saprolegnia parasitica (strain CBS 223.65) TaxID=695850 RepID=A0A067BRU1_SAPPC|nr:hypothetical protein SPRG_11038 [Saprolegnia parasitica CBS 223.65]KDO21179.1 hypothetical protein SPRG_11038 [Saprolegnia parasitica CBS 223.65]|eukprot:XP_012208090.1 hypothetical protein SPRG_11038 [Saprolegnia parasitica CBS 223.65]
MDEALHLHHARVVAQSDLSRHFHDAPPTRSETLLSDAATYVEAIDALFRVGSSHQHFEYLFFLYAQSHGDGISRSELLQLLQEHLSPAAVEADARFFEKIYTYLKRHFTAPVLSLDATLALLNARPHILASVCIDKAQLHARVQSSNARNQVPKELLDA